MFGLGKLVGGLVGPLLDSIGLGKLAPFIQLGINIMSGNWLGVAQDVFSLVSGFKSGDFLNTASKRPPLGGFEDTRNSFAADNNSLKPSRMGNLLRGLGNLINAFSGGKSNTSIFGSLGKIFDAFQLISDSFSNNQLYSNRASNATFNYMRS